MPAVDLAKRALELALAEVDKQALGEDIGVAVWTEREPAPQPDGKIQVVPGWYLELTLRNPLLGQHPLVSQIPIGLIEPREELITAKVPMGMSELRKLRASLLNGGAAKRTG